MQVCVLAAFVGVTGATGAQSLSDPGVAAAFDASAVKRVIGNDDRRRPEMSILLAERGLAAPGIAAEDRSWFRTRLVRDLARMESFDRALLNARKGQDTPNNDERMHFVRLELFVLVEAKRYQAALDLFDRSAEETATLGNAASPSAELLAADIWRLAAAASVRLARLSQATELVTRSLGVLARHPGAAEELAQGLHTLSLIHSRSERHVDALAAAQQAVDILKSVQEANMSSALLRLAGPLGLLGRTDEQYQTLLQARVAANDELRIFNAAVATTNLADVALQKKDYVAALRHAEEALPLVERTDDEESLWVSWVNRGIALNRLHRPGGIEWIRNAIAAFSAKPGFAGHAADVQGLLAEELAFNQDYKLAFEAAAEFKRLSDNVRSATDQKRIADANAAYEADKRQRKIEALEHEQRSQQRFRWALALAAVAGLSAALVALVSRQQVKRAYAAMQDMAFSDALTGLRNRRYLLSTVQDNLARARRARSNMGTEQSNSMPVFLMVDVDHFKPVNDLHGHAAGDAVLKQCAAVLQEQLRESDTLVRWGGEEFLVLAHQANGSEVHALAERLRAAVAAHEFLLDEGVVLRKTVSIGYACHPVSPAASGATSVDWNTTVALADQCLYVAKSSGRDMWVGIIPNSEAYSFGPADTDLHRGVLTGVWLLHSRPTRHIDWPMT